MANDRLLAIYLNDHLGAAALARERCKYAARQNSATELGSFLERLLREIEEDATTLRRVMDRVGATPSPLKLAVGLATEKIGRLKPNGQLTGYSPLSRLLELEFLSLGIEGKRVMWVVLGDRGDARLAEFDFAALAERAARQRAELEPHRLEAARGALA
jgi:hypothetical protein